MSCQIEVRGDGIWQSARGYTFSLSLADYAPVGSFTGSAVEDVAEDDAGRIVLRIVRNKPSYPRCTVAPMRCGRHGLAEVLRPHREVKVTLPRPRALDGDTFGVAKIEYGILQLVGTKHAAWLESVEAMTLACENGDVHALRVAIDMLRAAVGVPRRAQVSSTVQACTSLPADVADKIAGFASPAEWSRNAFVFPLISAHRTGGAVLRVILEESDLTRLRILRTFSAYMGLAVHVLGADVVPAGLVRLPRSRSSYVRPELLDHLLADPDTAQLLQGQSECSVVLC